MDAIEQTGISYIRCRSGTKERAMCRWKNEGIRISTRTCSQLSTAPLEPRLKERT